jgi:hypothetical protein
VLNIDPNGAKRAFYIPPSIDQDEEWFLKNQKIYVKICCNVIGRNVVLHTLPECLINNNNNIDIYKTQRLIL